MRTQNLENIIPFDFARRKMKISTETKSVIKLNIFNTGNKGNGILYISISNSISLYIDRRQNVE